MNIFVAHSSSFDFQNLLYTPLRQSSLNIKHTIHLPQEKGHEVTTIETIKSADLVLAEVSYPSTGQGIELGWANVNKIPIVCIYKKGSTPSNALQHVTKTFIEYENEVDMIQKCEIVFNTYSAPNRT